MHLVKNHQMPFKPLGPGRKWKVCAWVRASHLRMTMSTASQIVITANRKHNKQGLEARLKGPAGEGLYWWWNLTIQRSRECSRRSTTLLSNKHLLSNKSHLCLHTESPSSQWSNCRSPHMQIVFQAHYCSHRANTVCQSTKTAKRFFFASISPLKMVKEMLKLLFETPRPSHQSLLFKSLLFISSKAKFVFFLGT